jgi:pyrroloquinoline-quinone synthase
VNDDDFQEALLRILDRKDHAAWQAWTGPAVRRNQLLLHFQQEWLVFVRDFPRMLGHVYAACPIASVRRALAANLYEEETGGLSFHRPHPELFLDMMSALGFSRDDFETAQLLPAAARYRAFLDRSLAGPWVIGAAVVTIWVEGSVHERDALAGREEPIEEKARTHFLVRHHGLRPEQLMLMRAHAAVEGGHRHDAWETVLGHARTVELRQATVEALGTACELWHRYRDEVSRTAGITLPS